MSGLKDQAIIWSDRLRLSRLTEGSARHRLTTILYHQFRFGDEPWSAARERLRRQCDFLASAFHPVSIEDAPGAAGSDVDFPLLVTIDDAKRDILEVFDIFEEFGIPLVQFVCAGWSAAASTGSSQDSDSGLWDRVAGLTARLQFYDGPGGTARLGDRTFALDHSGNEALIDALIAAAEDGLDDDIDAFSGLEAPPPNAAKICDWDELRELAGRGMVIGCHSVTHPQIARHSSRRRRYEIAGSRRLIETHLGPCPWFAYPYGILGSYDASTQALLADEGFAAGFTTRPALAGPSDDPLCLPRIALPDRPMSQKAFEARVRGGGIPLSRAKGR